MDGFNENTRNSDVQINSYLPWKMIGLKQFLIFLFFFFSYELINAQDVKIGLLASPTLSWMTVNDASIDSKGKVLGMSMGVQLDYGVSSKLYITLGTSLNISQGGKLQYRDGGNFLPQSELKLPQFNNGPKPIADNSTLTYNCQFWSNSIGLKSLVKESATSKLYLEFPSFGLNRLVKARGSLSQDDKILTEEEDIMKDLRVWNLSVSGGIGIEKRINRNTLFYFSIRYIHFLSDLTLNNGFKAILIEKAVDPAPAVFHSIPENSKAIINGLALNLGLYF
ncbi:MAG: hypothetical protein ABI761_10255 [Saprospiraceae bacterium]